MATTVAASVGVGIGLGLAISYKTTNQRDPFVPKAFDFFISHYPTNVSSLTWGSLSLVNNPSKIVVKSKIGVSFPAILSDTRRLLGIGLRKKSIFGLKNIDVYAFGNGSFLALDKHTLVIQLRKFGDVVVTRNGTNGVPALQKVDIGNAMGKTKIKVSH